MRASTLVAIVLGSIILSVARAAPPANDHPVLGDWTITNKDGSCSETYRFHSDGTMFVSSGDEVAEVSYEISPSPSRKGFYRWAHKTEKDNGKNDCSGKVTKPGDGATWYIQLDQSQQLMMVCRAESTDACYGPMHRIR